MASMDREVVLTKLLGAARAAAEIVMHVYGEEDVGAELKGPNDPVTRADREANALLIERLGSELPGVPIVAEESPPAAYAGFGASPCALFVDPVDGTREFIDRNGEFCVMIGFAEEGRATVGVVLCPALGLTYAGAEGIGAFLVAADGTRTRIHVAATARLEDARCAISRSHRSEAVDAGLARLGVRELVPTGSAGVKGSRVAAGQLDVFAHPSQGAMKLWDACAPDAVIRAAGGVLTDARGRPFDYRGATAQGQGILAANPVLHAEAIRRLTNADAGAAG